MNKISSATTGSTDLAVDGQSIVNIACYKFVELSGLEKLRDRLKQCCKSHQLRGTILLSPEGINMFLAGSRVGIDGLLELVRSLPGLAELDIKESFSDKQPFNRMLVRLKREIIAFGVEGIAPAARTSPKLTAQQLKAWLDEGRPVRLLDTRNDYEVDLGTFHNSQRLNIQHFRDFPQAIEQLPESAKDEPLVMFCTGGIRCEKAGPMMESVGFRQVYQLDGGILKYFEECGGAHYDGGCFVFDNRVVLNPDLKPSGAILCFNCQSVLSFEDIQSPKFRIAQSCPHCYRTESEDCEFKRQQRERAIRHWATSQPGCKPYDNCRRMHVAARWAGLTMIEFLCAYHPPTTREQWLQWIEQGVITCDSLAVTADQLVREGQQVDQVQAGYTEPAVATDIELIFEDEALVIVNKPAPLPVHASGRYNRNTLEYFLTQAYRPEKLRLAHRLDAGTTGLIVLARKHAAARVIQPQFASGLVAKRYLLKVHGKPSAEVLECREPIIDEPTAGGGRELGAGGMPAHTTFRVHSRAADGNWVLEAEPHTGRTHQIRLHAWHLGLPIVGDQYYLPNRQRASIERAADSAPSSVAESVIDQPTQLYLHAWQLAFAHPFTGEALKFIARPSWLDAKSQA